MIERHTSVQSMYNCVKAFDVRHDANAIENARKAERTFLTPFTTKIVSEYDQEIPQSQTADNPVAPRGRAAQPSRDTRKTN